jgi:DNA invertase Pin-like site-specific DNA recombinase
MRRGDGLVITRLSRLFRSVRHLTELAGHSMNVDLIVLKQGIDTMPREGIVAAKQRGVYTGRKPALTAEQASELRARGAAGESKSLLAKEFGVSRETVYSYLRTEAVTD